MGKILDNIQKHLFIWILAAIFGGLAGVYFFGGYEFSTIICVLAALLMIYPSLVPLSFYKLHHAFKHKKIIMFSVGLNFILSPALALIIGRLFLVGFPTLRLGLLLISLLPGGGMATTWAHKSKADMLTTLGIIFTNLAVAIVAVPFSISLALEKWAFSSTSAGPAVCAISQATKGVLACGSATTTVSPLRIIGPIVIIIIIPMILAYLTQMLIKNKKGTEYFEKIKANFAKVSNLGLVVVLFVLMGLKENSFLFNHAGWILASIVPLMLFYGINILVALGVYKKFFRNAAGKAMVWGSYLRYITLALGLSISFVYTDPALVSMVIIVVLAYFIQIPSSFWLAEKLQEDKVN